MNVTKIYVAGHRGMVGSAILRNLQSRRNAGENLNLITRNRTELDLTDQASVRDFLQKERPDQIILAAAKVGGIMANESYPAQFIYENLMIECNVIHQAYAAGVRGFLYLGSSCIYPRLAAQPMAEDALLKGALEPTNEPYAVAKIAGIKLCESYNRQYGVDYRAVVPANLYGPGDNFHPVNSHVLPAIIRRLHDAVQSQTCDVVIWGTGKPRREFLHVDDMAAASLFVMDLPSETYKRETEERKSHINIGSGTDVAIHELAEIVARVVGYTGGLIFDATKPGGAPRKLMDVSKLARLGWTHNIELEDGIRSTYDWYLKEHRENHP